jgi:hypothetical protein
MWGFCNFHNISQRQFDDELKGPESLTEDEVTVAFEQCITEFPSAIDSQLEGYVILVN